MLDVTEGRSSHSVICLQLMQQMIYRACQLLQLRVVVSFVGTAHLHFCLSPTVHIHLHMVEAHMSNGLLIRSIEITVDFSRALHSEQGCP